ncbi:MAG: acyloxyacyl hydrolase [Proteobacteria bacterium]|nr:MAG: acyloxyacyl hydrolase [Pseudomonadota bacterium]
MSTSWPLRRLAAATALAAVFTCEAYADEEVQALAAAAGVVILTGLFIDPAAREEPSYVTVEGGGFDVVKDVQPAGALGAEYRSKSIIWWKLRPFVGVGFTTDQSLYGYAGLRLATYFTERFVITPSLAVGAYSRGEGKDLGDPPVVFRSGLDFEYVFSGGLRVGLAYHHISNGKLLGQSVNPGTEVVGATVSIPLK